MVWHFIGKVHNTKACKAGELRHLLPTLVAARETGTVKKHLCEGDRRPPVGFAAGFRFPQ
jgi:hypothetical protein